MVDFLWEILGKYTSPMYPMKKVMSTGINLPLMENIWLKLKTCLRKFQQTPGTYPGPLTTCFWRNSFIGMDLSGHLEYVPWVCTGIFLRVGDWHLILLRRSSHDLDTWLVTVVCFRSKDLGATSPFQLAVAWLISPGMILPVDARCWMLDSWTVT